jgi:uncharacterized protein (TIGR02646 family)
VRQIVKKREPASLTAHRQTPHSDYDNYRNKNDLRASLVGEQAGLCCYCMERVYADRVSTKIEHWRSQSDYPKQQLSYQNMLAGCKGGDDQPDEKKHCDSSKGNQDLKFNPADPAHHIETRVRYELDGSIHASDPEFDGQLNTVLHLNLERLKNNRAGVLSAVLTWWRMEKQRLQGPVPRAEFERKLEHWDAETPNRIPYCQVVVWWLRERLAGMA